ncbi:YceH family protein [soil metagenome]
MSSPAVEPARGLLNKRERRVLGVLVEKQKTTPENYPLSIAALVTGCNQKTNRDPITSYDSDDVEQTLQDLRLKGATVRIEGVGRVEKWRHNLYEWLDLKNRPVEMAILAELLLRGPQTEGDLRGRASRMDPIPDLATLQGLLEGLAERGLVVFLSPPGQRRGVVLTHGFHTPEELEALRQAHAQGSTLEMDEPAPARGWATEANTLRQEIEALRDRLEALDQEVQALKTSLGD